MLFARSMVVGSMAAALLACGGAVNRDEVAGSELAQVQQRAEQMEPLGTFVAEPMSAGDLVNLVLMTDGRFHAEQQVVCVMEPCNPVPMDGTFERVTLGASRQLRLYDAEKVLVASYEYRYDGSTALELRGEAGWQTMGQAAKAWCAQVADCPVQGLITPACDGNWHCHADGCMFHVAVADQPVNY